MTFTREQVYALLERIREVDQAGIYEGATDKPHDIQEIVLNLDEERPETNPLVIHTPFKNLFVEEATSTTNHFFLKPNAPEAYQRPFKFEVNSSVEFEPAVAKAYLHWPRQPGAKMVLKLSVNSKFKTGKLLSLNAGGISLSEGASIVGPTHVVLVANTAAQIAPANFNRKVATIENKTGADLFVGGDNTVNATTNEGIKIPPGSKIFWKNSAALWGFSVPGGKVTRIEEE